MVAACYGALSRRRQAGEGDPHTHVTRHHANTVCKAKANYNYMNMLALQEACPELWRPHEHPIG